MIKILTGLCGLALIFSSGCAIGPVQGGETARSVGKSNSEFVFGRGSLGYLIKWNYGLTEDLDFGVQFETFSTGIRLKYAFLNRPSGLSLAAALGVGNSFDGNHRYGDFLASYFAGSWEPYTILRYVRVTVDPENLRFGDGDIVFSADRREYGYLQGILGSRYWFDRHWALSLEAAGLGALEGVEVSGIFWGASVGYLF